MLIQESINLLSAFGVVSYFGTRDEKLRTSLAPTFGLTFDSAKNELIVYAEKLELERHLPNMITNGKVSVLVANPVDHYTNQFKGNYISHADCTEDERIVANKLFDNFRDIVGMGMGEAMKQNMSSIKIKECVKFIMKIEEVYDQTPGPGAGKLISN